MRRRNLDVGRETVLRDAQERIDLAEARCEQLTVQVAPTPIPTQQRTSLIGPHPHMRKDTQ